MATKMKGLFKGIKFISQIFVYKDPEPHEMEIGFPTDVRHVTHIGLEGSSVNNPTWMTELKAAPDFSSTSLAHFEQGKPASWACEDFQPAIDLLQQGSDMPIGSESSPKTPTRKKSKSASAAMKSSRHPRQSNPH